MIWQQLKTCSCFFLVSGCVNDIEGHIKSTYQNIRYTFKCVVGFILCARGHVCFLCFEISINTLICTDL